MTLIPEPISSLPIAGTVDGSEYVPIVQGGATKRTLISTILGDQDLSPYFKKDGTVIATGTFDLGGFNIQNINLLKVLDGGGVYNNSNNANIVLSALGSIDLTGTGFTYNGGNVELVANKGISNGYAGLDVSGKVPLSQLPAGIVGSMQYQGKWNANTNTPALASGTGTTGYFYIVGTAGTTNIDGNNNWNVGDWIVFDGTAWDKIDNYEAVTTVFGRVGNITLLASDVTGALGYTAANASTTFADGGNSFAANATLGTNDNYTLAFKTNNITALTFDTSQNATFSTTAKVTVNSIALGFSNDLYLIRQGTNLARFSTINGGSGAMASLEVLNLDVGSSYLKSNSTNTGLDIGGVGGSNIAAVRIGTATGLSGTSGNIHLVNIVGALVPTSGNASMFSTAISPQVNPNGTYSAGSFTALIITPYLQSVTGLNTINLLDVGTNTAASNTGVHTSYFKIDSTGLTTLNGNLKFKGGSRSIADDNGNNLIAFPSTVTSAINYLQVSNSASGSAVSITAQGSTNTSLNITTSGTGLLSFINGVGGSTQFFGQSSAGGNYLLVTLNQAVANVANRSSLKLACLNASSASIGPSVQGGLTVTTAGSETSILEFMTRVSGSDKVRGYINGNTWSLGAETSVGIVYRTSNTGSDLTPFMLIDPYDSVSSAGSNYLGYDPVNSNGLFWARTNGTRRIMRASLGLTNNTDTAGSEVSDLLLTTLTGGSFSMFGNILFYNGVPGSNPAAGKIYVYYDSGNLKARSSNGTITTIAAL